MEDSHKKATEMIIKLQNKNAKLRLALLKLTTLCDNTKQHLVSEIWQQQIGYAKQIIEETDPFFKNSIIEQFDYNRCCGICDGVNDVCVSGFGGTDNNNKNYKEDICTCVSTIGSFEKNKIFYCKTCKKKKHKQPFNK